ncbi:MAG: SurA N-terminal domain-containing protein [Nitrospirae bacterium]|nr:SurA N-terminal domain-containing protein [Nitrospirota bacterium]
MKGQLITILAIAVLLAARPAGAGVLLDGVAATVDGQVITVYDLTRAESVARILVGEDPASRARVSREDVLEAIVNQRLTLTEAIRLRMDESDSERVEEVLRQAMGRYASAAVWKAAVEEAGLSESDVQEEVEKQVRLLKYLHRRVPVAVTLADAGRYFEENQTRMGGASFGDVVDTILDLLREEKFNAAMKEYLEKLREAGEIRIRPRP